MKRTISSMYLALFAIASPVYADDPPKASAGSDVECHMDFTTGKQKCGPRNGINCETDYLKNQQYCAQQHQAATTEQKQPVSGAETSAPEKPVIDVTPSAPEPKKPEYVAPAPAPKADDKSTPVKPFSPPPSKLGAPPTPVPPPDCIECD